MRLSGLDWVSLRLANVYGPRNVSGPLPTFFHRLTEGKPCFVMDTRRDFIFVEDLVASSMEAIDGGARAAPTTSRPARTSRSRSCSTRRSRPRARARRPRSRCATANPDDALHDPARPRRTTEEFGWKPETPLGEGVAAGDRVLPRVRHRGDLHAPEAGSSEKPAGDQVTDTTSSSSAEPASSASNLVRELLARGDGSRGRRRQPALGGAGERPGRPPGRVRRGLDRGRRGARRGSRTSSTTSSTSRRITATRARSPTRSPTTSNNLITTLKLFERHQGLLAAAQGRLLSLRLHARAAHITTRRRRTTEDGPVPLDLDSPYQISKVVGEFYAVYYHRQHGLPTVRARFQNVYGPGEILGAGQWRGTPATVWRNVDTDLRLPRAQGPAAQLDNGGVAITRLHLRRGHRRGPLACATTATPGDVYNLASERGDDDPTSSPTRLVAGRRVVASWSWAAASSWDHSSSASAARRRPAALGFVAETTRRGARGARSMDSGELLHFVEAVHREA